MVGTIDYLYTRAVEKLQTEGNIVEFSRKLMSLKKNSLRTQYAYESLKKMSMLPEIILMSKSCERSDKFRGLGNECFKKHLDYEALQYYNLALLHAPPDTTQLSLAYANRSAVLHSIRRYKECLADIDIVLKLNYPKNIHNKLLHRQKLCTEADHVEKENNLEENLKKILTPMSTAHPEFTCASSKVKVCYSQEMGRHVLAAQDIDPGEVIAEEDPYALYLLKSNALLFCNLCCARAASLIPCDSCCIAMFCSEECKTKAKQDYHSIECVIGPTLVAMDFTKLELLALRVVIKARCEKPDWPSVLELVHKLDEQPVSDGTGMVKNKDGHVYNSKNYETIHTLATNEHLRSASDIFQKSVTAAVLLHLLEKTTFLNDGTDGTRECVGGMLLRHAMISPTNFHNVSTNVSAVDGSCTSSLEIASAAYGFLSLVNHSCAPNVVRCPRLGSGTVMLVALRPIKKGTQLFDNYGSHYALETKSERHASLKFQYKFDCVCEACQQNWPTFFSFTKSALPQRLVSAKQQLLNEHCMESLKMGDVGVALSKFKPLCNLAKSLEEHVPCSEVGEIHEAMKQCIYVVQDVLPYGYTQKINWEKIVLKSNV